MDQIGSTPEPQKAGDGWTVDKPIAIETLKGADEICGFVKEDPRQMCYLVENEQLPAWKRSEKGSWYALNVDLFSWMIVQRNKYLKDTPKYISKNPDF